MQLLGMRCAVIVDRRFGRDRNRINHKSVSLIVADKLVHTMRVLDWRSAAHSSGCAELRGSLPSDKDLCRRLNEEDRLDRIKKVCGDTKRPARHLARVTRFAAEHLFIALAQFLACPGLKNRAIEISNTEGRGLAWSIFPGGVSADLDFNAIRDEGMLGIERHRPRPRERWNEVSAVGDPTHLARRRKIGR